MHGLFLPDALRWQPTLTVIAAAVLTVESVLFVWVHARSTETRPIVMSAMLGLINAFVAYGRMMLMPIV